MVGVRSVSLLATLVCVARLHTVRAQTAENGMDKMRSVAEQLGRQVMMQQLYVEEKTRSEGDSGLKQVRMRKDGTKPYYVSNWANTRSVASIHDHSDLVRTCGMGELIAVLNGVEFRTRHNDYKLKMPATNSSDYHATEDIPFPDVPPEVLAKITVDEQVVEMREYFKAWAESNHTHRDYRQYFRPNLCYLEGAWTNDVNLDEPFDSDRHHIDADSWFDLQEKIRFTSLTGDKSNQENFAYLPTTIMSMTNGTPVFGQWNYRILCHPVRADLPLAHIKPLENLATRISSEDTFEEYVNSRAARFQINPLQKDDAVGSWKIDELMGEIPGKDNYLADITDSVFGLTKFELKQNTPLNVGFYNRWYRVREEGAMGSKVSHRGFVDRNLFVAESTQNRVAPVSVQHCRKRGGKKRKCETISKRMSYAIPLEIVYLTPLSRWNPFDIEFKTDEARKFVRADGRNGNQTPEKALNGSDSRDYYRTPVHFFSGGEVDTDSADSAKGSVGVLDRTGTMRLLKASGIRILLPEIEGVGALRTRFPVMPVHAEGDPVWKELEALRDVVMNMQRYIKYFESPPGIVVNETAPPEPQVKRIMLATAQSNPSPVGLHAHLLEIPEEQALRLKKRRNASTTVRTTEENNHSHLMVVKWDRERQSYVYARCDGRDICFDGHPNALEGRANSVNAP